MPDSLQQLAAALRTRAARYHDERMQRMWTEAADALDRAAEDIHRLKSDLGACRAELDTVRARLGALAAAEPPPDAGPRLAALIEAVEVVRATTREPTSYDKLTRAIARAGTRPRPVARAR